LRATYRHLVGDEEVGVELRVGCSRSAVNEARGNEPVGVDLEDTVVAPTRERRVLVDERERRGDGSLVRGEHLIRGRLIGDCPQCRDALRWREREGEPGDGALVVGVEAATERRAVARIGAVPEEPLQAKSVGLRALYLKHLSAAADELA
jgi:hypothetical protein